MDLLIIINQKTRTRTKKHTT